VELAMLNVFDDIPYTSEKLWANCTTTFGKRSGSMRAFWVVTYLLASNNDLESIEKLQELINNQLNRFVHMPAIRKDRGGTWGTTRSKPEVYCRRLEDVEEED
jgi:hypothetical protein